MMKNNAFELLDNQNPRTQESLENSPFEHIKFSLLDKESQQELISEANDLIDLMGISPDDWDEWRNSPFWQNRDIKIPWYDLNRGDVVVFHITERVHAADQNRRHQIWIVKFLEMGNNKGYFSYLLITAPPYTGGGESKLKKDFSLYRGKINSMVNEGGSNIYFGRNKKMEWTLLSNLSPNFMNWINENPFEVKS